jgi:hypothetical protein
MNHIPQWSEKLSKEVKSHLDKSIHKFLWLDGNLLGNLNRGDEFRLLDKFRDESSLNNPDAVYIMTHPDGEPYGDFITVERDDRVKFSIARWARVQKLDLETLEDGPDEQQM